MSTSNKGTAFFSNIFGQGSIYEELDAGNQSTNDRYHGKVYTGGLARLESDEEEDIEANPHVRPPNFRPTSEGPFDPTPPPPIESSDEDEDNNNNNNVPDSVLVEQEAHQSLIRPRHVSRQSPQTRNPASTAGSKTAHVAQFNNRHRFNSQISPVDRALWKWANVENLDNFLLDVYNYYLGGGLYSILLTRALNLLTLIFVVTFATFLTSCINYSKIPGSTTMDEIKIPKCMAKIGFFHSFVLWAFALFTCMKLFQYIMDIRRLIDMQNFYQYLLEIPESDMQTVSWQHVINKLVLLRDQNLVTATNTSHRGKNSQSKQRMDLCDIANRIMRQDNYLIAMINKDVLDLSIPIPIAGFKNSQFLTKTMEWHISLCIMDFAFNSQGQLRTVFLKETHRKLLADGLRRRFIFAGIMNIVVAPFGIVYLTLLYFFQYYGEYHKNPGSIGSRQYTPLGEWKFREFNELSHLFRRRMRLSYEPASRYINQFPKEKTAAVARFVSFVAGSFAAVLGIISLLGPEQFLGFEITKDRTVLFYIGVFTTILAVSRGMIPEDTLVFDPEPAIREVSEYTHYMPKTWDGNLHSDWVKNEFSSLYQYKILIILRELASVVIAPFVLWYSLPKSCDKVIDFFRDFSVHVDGLGYICSFAVFNFDKPTVATQRDLRENYFTSSDGKMLKSYLNFVDNYGMDKRVGSSKMNRTTKGSVSAAGATGTGKSGNMEESVMDRFSQLEHDKTPVNNLYRSELNTSTYTSSNQEPDYETMLDSARLSSANPEDGGVLGLLNQFYKQAGAGEGHKV